MDFWSRLTGGASKGTDIDSYEQRLTNFKRSYLQLQQSWQKGGRRQSDSAFGAAIVPYLQSFNRILRDEIHTPAPHLCIQNVATAQVYILVSTIGSITRNEQVIKEAFRFFGLLTESEDEDFINDVAFADSFISLVRAASAIANAPAFYAKTELAESLFAVAAQLRQQPEIPPAWFRPSIDTEEFRSPSASIPAPMSQEFPLIYMLLECVHCEGEVGDFARTGLLYILESTGRSPKLEKWIIESELATMMASGLGALYSQLSSKVVMSHPEGSEPPVLAFSEVIHPSHARDAEPIFSPILQANLATFLSYLAFWQDILERCPSADVKATFLDHFDFLFLRPLLYPSLVESSDIDSGSSVAVMTYLRCILENVTNTGIVCLVLHYMLGSSGEQQRDTKPTRPTTLARRRKSQTLIMNHAERPDDSSPDLLTLTDILQGYLTSRNPQTVTASLRLLATILRLWHDIITTKLFRVQVACATDERRSLDIHEQQLDVLYSMAEDILDDEGLEGFYTSHLQDAQVKVETHACCAHKFNPPDTESFEAYFPPENGESMQQRIIIPEDPLFACLLSLLEEFLVNDIETNLSLSENLAALASCGETRLEGWLLGPRSGNPHPLKSEDKAKSAARLMADAQASQDHPSTVSPILTRLRNLTGRVNKLRQDIQDFDIYLAERRHIFRVGEEINEALAGAPIRRSQDSGEDQRTKPREQVAIGSISERLKASGDVSRASSPRGRRESNIEQHQAPAKSLVGRLNHLRLSPSPSPSKTLERPYSPSPLRRSSTSSRTSSGLPSPRGPPDMLRRKIGLKVKSGRRRHLWESTDSEASSICSDRTKNEVELDEETKEISLSHLLTNIIILQEFILELAAIIQIRSSLFGEVTLD